MLGASLLTQLSTYAQTDTTQQLKDSTKHTLTASDTLIRYRINGTFLKSIFTDLGYTVARPAHWKGKDFAKFGAVLGGAGLLMVGDYSIKQVFLSNHQHFWTSVTNEIEPFGNAYS